MSNSFRKMLDLVNNSGSGINLFFLMKSSSSTPSPTIKFVNLADEEDTSNNTSQKLLKSFQEHITLRISPEDFNLVLSLSSADSREKAIYRYDLDEVPHHFKAMSESHKMALLDIKETFHFRSDELDNIQGIIIVIGDAEDRAVFYKQNYPISLLKRDNFSLIPIPHSTRFKKLDTDLLKLDINFHFMLFDNVFYIFNLDKLESLTGFDGIIKKEAEKSIDAIKEMGLISDVEPLLDEIDDVTFARKLTRIYKDSKVIGKISNSKIIEFVKNHSYFKKNPIKQTTTGDRLIIDTKVSKNALIRLLNDDLLFSNLTQSEYESVAKNNIEP